MAMDKEPAQDSAGVETVPVESPNKTPSPPESEETQANTKTPSADAQEGSAAAKAKERQERFKALQARAVRNPPVLRIANMVF